MGAKRERNQMQALSNVHFFRRVPKDMTEATAHGGFVSILGAVVMVLLFLGELSSYMTVETSSKVVMDQDVGKAWAIEFNITMAHIPCKYATLELADLHGSVQHNVTANIERWHVDESFEPYLEHVSHDRLEYEEVAPVDQAQEAASMSLNTDLFDDQIKQFAVAMVNFHAPWCMWCRRLAPIWETAARESQEKFGTEVLFAQVDCTHRDSAQLCRALRIMAFPTVRVFKDGLTQTFHEFDGPRSVQGLLQYAQHARWATDALYEQDKAEQTKLLQHKLGSPEAKTGHRAQGCRLSGHVVVSRAPGNMHITINRDGTSFASEHINVTHLVHHFSFGDLKTASLRRGLRHGALHPETKVHHLLASGFSSLSGSVHVTNYNVTQEHYLKVVRAEHRRDAELEPRSASYQYTVTNAQFEDQNELPSAKFSYDLSPMQVLVLESSRSFTHFVTSVCAIVGGVYTMIGIFDAVLHHSVRKLEVKSGMGKLS